MNNWEKLCFTAVRLIKGAVAEREFNNAMYSQLETNFDWYKGSIQCEAQVDVGNKGIKRADFVLVKDGVGIVIELKKPGVNLEEAETQIKSYVKLLEHDYGFLIGDQIKCYYRGEQGCPNFATIEFKPHDEIGQLFAEILHYDNFLSGNLDAFRLKAIELMKKKPSTPPPPPTVSSGQTGQQVRGGAAREMALPPEKIAFFKDLVTYYNEHCARELKEKFGGEFRAGFRRDLIGEGGNGDCFSQIPIRIGRGLMLYYEFLVRRREPDYFSIEIHNEIDAINKFISTITEENERIENFPIENRPNNRGRYRPKIALEDSVGIETIARVMKELINRKHGDIIAELDRLKL